MNLATWELTKRGGKEDGFSEYRYVVVKRIGSANTDTRVRELTKIES